NQAYVSITLNDSRPDGLVVPGISSASWNLPVSVGSWVSAFGINLAPRTEAATPGPLPTTLGGVRVHVGFAATGAADFLAPLLYVSPTQINYRMTPGDASVSEGTFAFVTIETVGKPFVQEGVAVPVSGIAPGFFTMGKAGLAAASAVRVTGAGVQTPVSVFSCSTQGCAAAPIDLSTGSVYLSLYGTGFSSATASDAGCTAAGISLPVVYAGPQIQVPGVDQLNVALPGTLAGAGAVSVQCAI